MHIVEKVLRHKVTKVGLLSALGIPLLLITYQIVKEFQVPGSVFGADPGKEVVDFLGEWSIRILYLTLAVSSIARLTKTPQLIRYRRGVGLWAFFYVICHFLSYFAFIVALDIHQLYVSVYKRPYIVVGALALLTLIPLAITSTNGWQRRLRRNWKRLHRLVYITAIAAWIHLFWLEKGSFEESAVYGIVLTLLLVERLAHTIKRRRARPPPQGNTQLRNEH